MSIIEPKRIDNYPNDLRWSYGGNNYGALEGVKVRNDESGTLTFLFAPTWRQRLAILFGRGVYVSAVTFAQPLQPLRVDAGKPEFLDEAQP